MVKGRIDPEQPTLVRVHLENPISDLTGSIVKERSWPISDILKRLSEEDTGVLVILCDQFDAMELIQQIESYKTKQQADKALKQTSWDQRTIGLGAQILSDLGVRKMRVLSAPKVIHALSGFDLEIVEYVQ